MHKRIQTFLFFPALLTALFSCNNKDQSKETMDENTVNHGIDLHYMDTTVNPKDDFYNYVNGTWMKEVEIPEDQNSWGSFNVLRKNTDDDVLALLNEAIKDNHFEKGSDQAKAVTIYHSFLDSNTRNELGVTPILPIIKQINQVTDLKSLQILISANPVEVANPFFGIYASPKPEESKMNGAKMGPGGLGLPDREYYLKTDSDSKKIRSQYVDHITRMLQFLGDNEEVSRKKATRILALETKLAKDRMAKEDRRDARKLNNPRSIEQISKLTPSIDWNQWIENLVVKKEIDTIIVTQLDYMTSLQKVLTSESIENIKELIVWQTLNHAANKLSTEIDRANWEFYSQTLRGTPSQRPAEERALATVNGTVGEAIGKIYVEKHFPAAAKETAKIMVDNIIETYGNRIQDLEWMSEETKAQAAKKLNSFTVKIGYPDKWKDYSDMDINAENSYYKNMTNASLWSYKFNLSKINNPVDQTEWYMNPQTVNAYYNSSSNEMVFPAAILQPPFFDYKADMAVNFGGIGAVIGHEITHGFDDQGSRFDADGNLKNWWTDEDRSRFEARTKKLDEFYSSIQVEDSLYLNGTFTLGENTADLGGVLSAYYGMQRYYETHEKPDNIDGFSQEQRFFISWATIWRTKTRPEALRLLIKTNPHAPGYYRAYLPLQNVDAFYDAFDIQEENKLYIAPEKRIRIW